jgi:hypothetical protein
MVPKQLNQHTLDILKAYQANIISKLAFTIGFKDEDLHKNVWIFFGLVKMQMSIMLSKSICNRK